MKIQFLKIRTQYQRDVTSYSEVLSPVSIPHIQVTTHTWAKPPPPETAHHTVLQNMSEAPLILLTQKC